ncbi:MAG: hypothetical protein QXS21_06050 [Thermoproteota archaeon]
MQIQTPLLELENYIVTYFGSPEDIPKLLDYTKYRLIRQKTSEEINIFHAKIKGKGKKWVETTFTEKELKGVRDAVLIHNISLATDYLVVYDPKKPVEIKKKKFALLYIDDYDPYFLDNLQYLTRHVLRLFGTYELTEQSTTQDILEKNKDEFAKRLVTSINKDCTVEAISPVVTAVVYYSYKKVECLFFDVL